MSRVTFSDAPATQLPLLYPWDDQESWCLVLSKVTSVDPVPWLATGISQLDMPYASGSAYRHPHQFEMLTLVIPSNNMAAIPNAGQLDTRNTGATLALAAYIDSLVSVLPGLTSESAPRVAAMTRALVASYFAPTCVPRDPAESISKPLLFERARRVVRQHMLSPDFGPEQLCQLLAVSRSKLYRLFESSGGVVNFINSERLNSAREKLCDPHGMSTINKIGTDVGFCDHSTFSRAFKRKFGCSPSEARSKAFINSGKASIFDNHLNQMSDKVGSVPIPRRLHQAAK